MMKVIVIIIPTDNCGLTVEEIQAKDVPTGKTSYIVDKSDIPTDRSFRNAWTYTSKLWDLALTWQKPEKFTKQT